MQPWGGERNLALRRQLGLVEGEIGMVDMHGTVQLVVDTKARADHLSEQVTGDLRVWQRRDGRWVVWAEAPE